MYQQITSKLLRVQTLKEIRIKSTADVEGTLNQKNLSIEDGAKLKIKAETY